MRIVEQVFLTGVLLATSSVAQAQTRVPDSLPAGVTAEMIADGKRIFHGPGVCYACHGQNATGGMAPSLADTLWIHSRGEYDGIVAVILSGVTAKDSKSSIMMPPRGGSTISDADARAVAAYVWALTQE